MWLFVKSMTDSRKLPGDDEDYVELETSERVEVIKDSLRDVV